MDHMDQIGDQHDSSAAGDRPGESNEHFRLLVEGVRDYAIYMLDPTGHILSWNSGGQLKGEGAPFSTVEQLLALVECRA